MKNAIALLFLAALVNAAQAHGAEPAPQVIPRSGDTALPRIEAIGAKIKASDILGASAPDLEIGPTPPIGSSRIVERAEIERAFVAASLPLPKKIPVAVRVSRKTRRLGAVEVSNAIRSAIAEMHLPRGASLVNVRAAAAEVPADYQRVLVDLPTLPRRVGPTTAQATITFVGENGNALQKTITPVELVLPADAAIAQIPRGAPITLVVRRGLVEVSITAVAAIDGDVGEIIPVTIRPSGRMMRARAIDKDHAVSVEES